MATKLQKIAAIATEQMQNLNEDERVVGGKPILHFANGERYMTFGGVEYHKHVVRVRDGVVGIIKFGEFHAS